MKNRLLYPLLITLFIVTSCKKGYLPKPEHITYKKTDYNGFYNIGEKGKEFKVLHDSTIVYTVIKEEAVLLNRIKKATVMFSLNNNSPKILIELDKKGTKQFFKLSKKNIGQNIAIIFNNKLFVCPIVNGAIEKEKVQVSGFISLQEAVNIVAYINKNNQKQDF